MAKRKETEAFILKYIDAILPGSENATIYKAMFAQMDDEAFNTFMGELESGKRFLVIIAPNFGQPTLSLERNFKIADEIGHEFFQRLWMGQKGDCPAYLTPIKYLVVDLPVRRASQLLRKKISIPENNKTVDAISGQPTGESKGAKVSFPELQVLASMGLDNSISELIKYRGGDKRGHTALNMMISRYGAANLETLGKYASGVESTKTLRTFLNSMMLSTTL